MTSDAKIGLLLGGAFIAVIAFLINGLPDLYKEAQANETISNSITTADNPSLLLDHKAEQAVEIIETTQPIQIARKETIPPKSFTEERDRFKLPGKVTEVAVAHRQKEFLKAGKIPQTYIVQSGDNMAVIAKRFYGSEWGNKRATIQKMFALNDAIISSPDRIRVGMRIAIPSLSSIGITTSQNKPNFSTGFVKKVKNAFGKAIAAKRPGVYYVQPGDSLWKIAQNHLGDGSRYEDIVELNDDIIADSEDITVGMQLKLPRR
ncbi:MAG TPA: LysM peptidoglycan-binding domain-containing protein [Phycisphaerales bacterium]|nr:LysM peptidoglycan-binding domain-containing protein [Phycisphaerales bacterium]